METEVTEGKILPTVITNEVWIYMLVKLKFYLTLDLLLDTKYRSVFFSLLSRISDGKFQFLLWVLLGRRAGKAAGNVSLID